MDQIRSQASHVYAACYTRWRVLSYSSQKCKFKGRVSNEKGKPHKNQCDTFGCRAMRSKKVFITSVGSRVTENWRINFVISNQSRSIARWFKENSFQLRPQESHHAQDSDTRWATYQLTLPSSSLAAEMTLCAPKTWLRFLTISICSCWIKKCG
jgi:hypothetical protein